MKKTCTLFITMLLSISLMAQPGSLDPAFRNNGTVVTPFTGFSLIIKQPDGKLLVLGKAATSSGDSVAALFRFHANGMLDKTFGNNGIVENVTGPAVALHNAGGILTGGNLGQVSRYEYNGALDRSFGENGRAVPGPVQDIDYETNSAAMLAVQANGKIIVATNASDGAFVRYVLTRYHADGTQDLTFGTNGKVVSTQRFESRVQSMQLQGDDKIVVVGYEEEQGIRSFVIRYTADGAPDVENSYRGDDTTWLRGLQIQEDGRYLLWGWKDNRYCLMCSRLYHYEFFALGNLTVSFDPGFSIIKAATQGDGKILVAGKAGATYLLKRYTPEGALDTTFGERGNVVTSHPIRDMLVAGERLYVAGGNAVSAYRLGLSELCNGKDDNCDGQVDEGCGGVITWYRDADGDGFGNPAQTKTALVQPRGYVANNLDCNDKDSRRGGPEVCDGRDNDCDGIIDEGLELKTFYSDFDGDGWGSLKRTVQACAAPPRYVSRTGDCDDVDNTVYPGAPELCDGKDNDCNGTRDDGLTMKPFYWDGDGDGYGYLRPVYACAAPRGYITTGGDCNDEDPSIHPGAVGRPGDGIDNNCNGLIDERVKTGVVQKGVVEEEGALSLQLSAAPNPTTHYFRLRVQSRSNSAVQLRIIDNMGRVVEARGGVAANTTLAVGHSYKPGVYFAEAVQEGKRTTLKLVKTAP